MLAQDLSIRLSLLEALTKISKKIVPKSRKIFLDFDAFENIVWSNVWVDLGLSILFKWLPQIGRHGEVSTFWETQSIELTKVAETSGREKN